MQIVRLLGGWYIRWRLLFLEVKCPQKSQICKFYWTVTEDLNGCRKKKFYHHDSDVMKPSRLLKKYRTQICKLCDEVCDQVCNNICDITNICKDICKYICDNANICKDLCKDMSQISAKIFAKIFATSQIF